jgi:hypothetical protein
LQAGHEREGGRFAVLVAGLGLGCVVGDPLDQPVGVGARARSARRCGWVWVDRSTVRGAVAGARHVRILALNLWLLTIV